jgi:eukaryotic-like serine/threonine-protein kinase
MQTLDPPHDSERRVSHYRLLYRLGAGGMGEVYAAVDETLGRRVALKAIRPEHRLNADSRTRFLREARLLSQLDHPNICRVHDYFEENDSDWLVLELIEGENLRLAATRLDVPARIAVAEQIAAVLVVTHAAGVVHRDLKPSNVMITDGGAVKVLDFGLARSVLASPGAEGPSARIEPAAAGAGGLDIEATHTAVPGRGILADVASGLEFQTQRGSVTGTVGYMSPEQASGEPGTAASDLYSFGLLLQDLMTGRRPYDETLDYLTLLDKAQRGERLPAVGLSADVAALVDRLTALAPTQRPTAVEAADRLRWIREKPKRRLRWLAAAAVVVIALGAAAKYTFDLAQERAAAVAARDEADRRREQAETLIGFMLGNLRAKLQQAGRLELLEDVGREATAYFKAVPPGSMSGEELFRRSQALYQIGQIRQAEGKLKEATEAYRESLAVATEVSAKDPKNAEWRLGVATAHFYLGDVLRFQSDLDGSMREFVAYRDIARSLAEAEPANDRWALELSYGMGAVAAVSERRGELEGARRDLESALDIKRELAKKKPDDLERQQALATGHNRLGVVLDKLGQTDAALKHYIADLEIRRALVAAHPTDYAIKRTFQLAISAVGRAYEESGDLAGAATQYRAWREVTAEYAAVDKRNADWQRDLAVAEVLLAGVLRLSGSLSQSEQLLRRALSVLGPLARGAPGQALWQRDLANAELGLGRTLLDRGDTSGASIRAGNAERIASPLAVRGADRDSARLMAEAKLLAADIAERAGDAAAARRLRESVLTLLPVTTTGALEKRAMATTARALLALGRVSEARPLVERLTALGYRHPTLLRLAKEKGG